jgi:hypothetical protein
VDEFIGTIGEPDADELAKSFYSELLLPLPSKIAALLKNLV